MFEVGKNYNIEMLDTRDQNGHPDITSSFGRKVVAINGPLVEFSDGSGGTVIINTYSPVFVRAKKSAPSSGKFATGTPPQNGM